MSAAAESAVAEATRRHLAAREAAEAARLRYREEMTRAWERGVDVRKLAEIAGVSRARVYQIIASTLDKELS